MLTYFLIIARPWKFNEVTGSLTGAALMLLFLQPHHVLEALGFATQYKTPGVATWNVVVILVELMIISTFLEDYGLFEWCATKAMSLGGGDGKKIFDCIYLITCIISTFASNNIAILTMTPVILMFCRRTGFDPKPFMYSSFFAANIASMFLLPGNLTNIMIGDGFHIGYLHFTAFMFLPTIAALILNYAAFRFWYNGMIDKPYQIEKTDPVKLIKDKRMVYLGIIVLAFVLIAFGFANNMGIPPAIVTTLGIIPLYLAERRPLHRTVRVSWGVAIFVFSLFIVVKGLEVSGLNTLVSGLILSIVGQNPILTTYFISLSSALLCNVFNNIPMTAMMVPITTGIAGTRDMALALAYSLVIGSNLGANITITGALAGILWLETGKAEGWSTNIIEFVKTGLMVTPLAILSAASVLALQIILV